ncbi:MAG: CHAD domain-containing protein [Nocardioides sp.]
MAAPVEPQDQPLAAYLAAHVEAAMEHLEEVPERTAIHQTRVALRRLRSTLRVFADLVELSEERLAWVDEELSWFAGILGEVRDRQVQRARFITVLAEIAPEDVAYEVVVRVATRIELLLLTEERAAATVVEETLVFERYRTLRALLEEWRVRPPVALTDSAKEHRRDVRTAAKAATKKADKRLAAAVKGIDDEALHRARKAAKRARYAAEVLRPLGSDDSEPQRSHYKGLQEVLGDFQDAVVAQETIRRLAAAVDDTESAFVLGLLYAQAADQAAQSRHRARALTR